MITAILILMAVGMVVGLFILVMSSGRKPGGRHNQAPMSAVNAQESVSKSSVRQG